jgi:hypothetical protein
VALQVTVEEQPNILEFIVSEHAVTSAYPIRSLGSHPTEEDIAVELLKINVANHGVMIVLECTDTHEALVLMDRVREIVIRNGRTLLNDWRRK